MQRSGLSPWEWHQARCWGGGLKQGSLRPQATDGLFFQAAIVRCVSSLRRATEALRFSSSSWVRATVSARDVMSSCASSSSLSWPAVVQKKWEVSPLEQAEACS